VAADLICGNRSGKEPGHGQARQKHRAALIVEDDAELRALMAALFETNKWTPSSAKAPAVAVLAPRLSASSLEVYRLVVTRGHRTEL
jgi:hypothetical protein